MRTYIALVLALGVVGCQAPATSSPPTPAVAPKAIAAVDAGAGAADPWLQEAPKPKKDPIAHPLFWRVEKDGKTTYFLGTMHTGVDAETRLPDVVWQKLDAAPVFAMEADINSIDLGILARTDGHTLHEDLGPVYWKKLEDEITPLAAKRLDRMKPMVAATMVSLKGLPTTAPMDGVLQSHAINEKKSVVFLEAAEKQARLLDKYMNEKALKMMLDHHAESLQATQQMVAAYLTGDGDLIVKLGDDERTIAKQSGFTDAEIDAENEDMLVARNASWIDELEKLHAQNNGFVAVGAMHLLGKQSVLELLAARGFKVTRVQ